MLVEEVTLVAVLFHTDLVHRGPRRVVTVWVDLLGLGLAVRPASFLEAAHSPCASFPTPVSAFRIPASHFDSAPKYS